MDPVATTENVGVSRLRFVGIERVVAQPSTSPLSLGQRLGPRSTTLLLLCKRLVERLAVASLLQSEGNEEREATDHFTTLIVTPICAPLHREVLVHRRHNAVRRLRKVRRSATWREVPAFRFEVSHAKLSDEKFRLSYREE